MKMLFCLTTESNPNMPGALQQHPILGVCSWVVVGRLLTTSKFPGFDGPAPVRWVDPWFHRFSPLAILFPQQASASDPIDWPPVRLLIAPLAEEGSPAFKPDNLNCSNGVEHDSI